jgi:quercetin dioxygenase-like cupin family protein
MSSAEKKTKWMVNHVDDLPVEALEGIRIIRVLEGTAFDNIGCEYVYMEKGQQLDSHVHQQANSFILILRGEGLAELEDQVIPIRQGHLVYVPAGVSHAFRTTDEPMIMYGFQSPPIIQNEKNIDIFFDKTGHQGELTGAAD